MPLPPFHQEPNPVGRIVLVLDNFRSPKARATMVQAERLDIDLVSLPPYSPDLNPIEYIWKGIKRVISDRFVKSLEEMRTIIARSFLESSAKLTFARSWVAKFLGGISIDSWVRNYNWNRAIFSRAPRLSFEIVPQ